MGNVQVLIKSADKVWMFECKPLANFRLFSRLYKLWYCTMGPSGIVTLHPVSYQQAVGGATTKWILAM